MYTKGAPVARDGIVANPREASNRLESVVCVAIVLC